MSFPLVAQSLDLQTDYRGPQGVVQPLCIQWLPAVASGALHIDVNELRIQSPSQRLSSASSGCLHLVASTAVGAAPLFSSLPDP